MTRIPRSDLTQTFQAAVDSIAEAAGPDGIASRADVRRKLATLEEPERSLTGAYYDFVDAWDAGRGSRVTRRDLQDSLEVAKRTHIDAFDPDDNGISEREARSMTPLGQLAVRCVQQGSGDQNEKIKRRYSLYRDRDAFEQLKNEARLRGEPVIERTSPPSPEAIAAAARFTEAGTPMTPEAWQEVLDTLRAFDELDPLTALMRTLGAPHEQAGPLARDLRLSDEHRAYVSPDEIDAMGILAAIPQLLRELGEAPRLTTLKNIEALRAAATKVAEMAARPDSSPATPDEEAALDVYRAAVNEANAAEVFVGRTSEIHDLLSPLPYGGATLDEVSMIAPLADAIETKTDLLNALADGAAELLHVLPNVDSRHFEMLRALAILDLREAKRLGPAFFAAAARFGEA
ncbi:MAG: hypothetical protein IPK13_25680 [Deltaproteobacteria bacterium]|nr:hypothetical protein [Deltaproteobacteria bacterium]